MAEHSSMNGEPPDFDAIFKLCQHQHRRIVLAVLAHEQRSVTLNDLTKAVLKYNHQTPIAEVPEDLARDIRLSLYHSHLPILASKEVVSYDPSQQTVEPTQEFDRLQPTLSAILDFDLERDSPIKEL